MKCPLMRGGKVCGAPAEIIESRMRAPGERRRRYQCFNNHRFTTLESIVAGSETGGAQPTGKRTGALEPTEAEIRSRERWLNHGFKKKAPAHAQSAA